MSNAQFNNENANVLVPTQELQQVSPWHAARTSVVHINPNPDAGDVYKVGSRWNEQKKETEDLYALTKPALMRIAAAAGIVWNWRESGPVVVDKDLVIYKAVGAIRLPDGSWQPIVAMKEISLTVIEEETYEANLKKAREYAADPKKQVALKGLTPEQWAQAQTRANMLQWRKNKLMRAETGAMLRVIRAALGMKSQYTREELEKPFVVPRIDFSPDYSDPEVRKAIISNGIQAMATLFGSIQSAQPAPFARLPLVPPEDEEEGARSIDPVVSGPPEPSETPDDFPTTGPIDQKQAQAGQPDMLSLMAGAGKAPEKAPQGQKGKAPVVAYCSKCNQPITSESVVAYSTQHYGQPVCMKCQKTQRGAANG